VALPSSAVAAQPETSGKEDASLATATTRSYQQQDGSIIQRVFGAPVNVRDAAGDWKHVDTDLSKAGGSLGPARSVVPVSIPSSLDTSAAKVGGAGRAVTLESVGLHGAASVGGDTATFKDAAPGVRAQISALADGVKHAFVLNGSAAPDHLDLRLAVSDGLEVRPTSSGGANVVNDDGQTQYELSPTVGWVGDATSGAQSVPVAITKADADQWRVRIDLSASWIREALVDKTVTIDPTLTATAPSQDALLRQSTPDTGGTSNTTGTLAVGENVRSLLQFDISTIPEDARILDTSLSAFVQGGPTTGKNLTVHEVTAAWTDGAATWNARGAGQPWTAAGGDFLPTATDTVQNVTGSTGWTVLHPTSSVQRWVSGTARNNGLLLKTSATGAELTLAGKNATGTYADKKPYLQVRYAPAAGQRRDDTFFTEQLNDRTTLGVAVASGNALLSSRDVAIAGVGQPLDLTRSYNSALADHQTGTFGNGGTSNFSGDVRLVTIEGGHVALHLGDGAVYRYIKNTGGGFDAAARLEADLVRNPDSTYTLTYRRSQSKWTFTADGKLSKLTDKNGNAITLTYTGTGVLSKITDTQGRDLTVTVNTNGQITTLEDPTGRQWTYVYGGTSGNRLQSFTNPEGDQTTYAYNGQNRLRKITTPGGRVTLLNYDADGRIASYVRVTNADDEAGPTTQLRYDQTTPRCSGPTAGRATIVTDPRGNETIYCTNTQLQVVSTIDAKGQETATTYTPQGQVQQFSNGTGTGAAVNKATYATSGTNPTNNLTEIKGPSGETTTFGYKPPNANNLTDTYQPQNQVTPDGKAQFFGYDAQGNLTSVKDTSTTAPNQQSTMTRNGDGTIATAKDGENRQTTYGYYTAADGGSRKGLLKTFTPPAPRAATTLNYDTLGRVTSATNGNSKTTTYTYDKLDRVKTITFDGGSVMSFTYDKDGNQTQRADTAGGTYGYSYDELNRRTGETLPGSRTVTYTYDAAGNLLTLTDGSGSTGYGYDQVNQNCYVAPDGPGGNACSAPPSGAITFSYNALGQRTQNAFPNGVVTTISQDLSGRNTGYRAYKGSTLLVRGNSEYVGDMMQFSTFESAGSNGFQNTQEYGYDSSRRLSSIQVLEDWARGIDPLDDSEAVTLTYDKAGNRTGLNNAVSQDGRYPGSQSYTYNGANQQAPNGAGAYDPEGNKLSGLTYNSRNQTTAMGATSLSYGGPNQAELISVGTKTIENNLLGKGRILENGDATAFVRDSDGTLLARKAPGSTWSYYVLDRLGSVVGITNAAGGLANAYDYDVDGNALYTTVQPTDFGYTGALNVAGKYHNSLRWYDPATARWTQPDSLDQPGDLQNANPYLYVGSNPTNYVDPTGKSFGCATLGLGGVCEAVVSVVKKGANAIGKRFAQSCFAITFVKDSSFDDFGYMRRDNNGLASTLKCFGPANPLG
jgi:RHS repeat-associated protein